MLIRIKIIYYLKLVIWIKTQNQDILIKKAKRDTLESLYALYEGREMVLNVFKSGIFEMFSFEGTCNPDMVARVTQVSDRKVSDPPSLKILGPK